MWKDNVISSTLAAKRGDLVPFSLLETCDSKITLMEVEQLPLMVHFMV